MENDPTDRIHSMAKLTFARVYTLQLNSTVDWTRTLSSIHIILLEAWQIGTHEVLKQLKCFKWLWV